ncbi:zinc finger protein 2 isoform X3 [Drosophila subpulchrella]|uniref:zinc finger protein 2 isoform X3 n=1 Tax=Drosophila subpulchrella TaxID=1486046 RepID=UPI0018A1668F|nr:zinc finger protein 2 isoform X3 [Drosophila subpulchrella]XP_037712489.1 zinc finger protein 2 isoform X3 [Drosophila subpulchrella]
MSSSDVETFNGKIVYNLDGSAYIIATDNANGSGSGSVKSCYASTSTSLKKLLRVKDRVQVEDEKEHQHQHYQDQSETQEQELADVDAGPGVETLAGATYKSSPKIHSFRVVSAQDANSACQDQIRAFKIQKPILMCFICKLSFGNVKSFSLHANSEHRLNLEELDQQLLNREYSSAIIQRNMDEKPQISFLQPLDNNAACAASDDTEKLKIAPEGSCPTLTPSPQPVFGNESELELESKQEAEQVRVLDQGRETDPEADQDSSSSKMAAPSAYLPLSSPKVAVKPTVKFGSLNSATAKTNNLSKVSSTSSPTSAFASGEVSLPSTDNISINKSTNCNQGTEPPSSSSSEVEMKMGSMSASPQTNESDVPCSDFMQLQHVAAGGIYPPQVSSFHASLAALAANESNDSRVKLITEFLQQQLQQHQQQSSLFPSQCPDHPDLNGVDCKTCELLDIQQRSKSPSSSHQHLSQSLPQLQVQSQPPQIPHRSPCSNSVGLAISPSASSVASAGNATSATSSFTIGACSEHINGRPQGVDCARCEMLLNSARLNSGVQMSTRNSCKTLKCPQCNWHYKYQETLEIHMREKHPDGESACGYCLAGQQHPRLARGESYSCGYKPYRCEICNYSTTTKGNLSIHMQSDKHLNNMQELNSSQNMVAAAAAAAATSKLLLSSSSPQGSAAGPSGSASSGATGSASSGGSTNVGGNASLGANAPSAGTGASNPNANTGSNANSAKPKPSFRCDICSYETSVARNLRIHMTSEKHTHNMAVLQNNIKHIQAFNFLQQQQQGAAGSVQGHSSGGFMPEVALADLAYNQALMIQLLHQQQQHQQSANTKLSPSCSPVSTPDQFCFSPKPMKIGHGAGVGMGLGMPMGMSHSNEVPGDLTGDPHPLTKTDKWPTAFYSCLICDCFSTNNLDDLNQHLLVDRSRQSSSASSEIMVIHNNNYICRLCNYKTNLKANFQLHSKTDKHLQKLNFINHIREGGPRNEYKLQYQQQLAANVVQVKCNCCDFHTNSIQKLSLHTQQMRHDTMRMIFQHLLYIVQQSQMHKKSLGTMEDDPQCSCPDEDQQSQSSKKLLLCQLCNFTAKNLHEMVQHIKGMRHMQIEQFICLQRRSENQEIPALNEVFRVTEWTMDNEDIAFETGFNLSTTVTNEATADASYAAASSASGVSAIPDVSIFSPTSPSGCATPGGKSLGHNASPNLNNFGSGAPVPTTVFKCNLCEYFVQSKSDMASHIETEHPCAESDDFISIPTNTAALQAFQTAVAAAALAAVQQRCAAINAPAQDTGEADKDLAANAGDGPVAIKRERLEEEDDPMAGIEDTKEVAHQATPSAAPESPKVLETQVGVQCPLCLENHFREKIYLEAHLTSVHSVTKDGLSRLLLLVDQKAWKNESESTDTSNLVPQAPYANTEKEEAAPPPSESPSSANTNKCTTATNSSLPVGMQGLSCQQCEASFKHEEQLLQHAQQNQHFSSQNGEYLCLAASHISRPCYMSFRTISAMITHFQDSHMSLVISERHVYKYRCKQCSLAFKTQEKLTTHMLYHTMRDATKCSLCQRNFRSTQALQKHMEQAHSEDGAPSGRSSSPQTPTLSSEEAHKLPLGETHAVEREVIGNDVSPLRLDSQQSKETRLLSPSPMSVDSQAQQQYLATFAALLKQQQGNSEAVGLHPEALPLSAGEFSQHLQGLQNLQNLQNMQQQFGAVAAASGLPINPVDMLNLMQFHHLMSLNFMNLAPPLVFGGGAAGSNAVPASTAQNNIITSSTVAASSGLTDVQLTSGVNALPVDSAKATLVAAQPQHNVNSNSQLASNQKRARTRITDDQLKILRAHFDINNSPSEESIMEMSQKANLPMKVVKHWFRNTLFKERQRNKDSPYNFNNPPSTTLNLEEYERTGQTKVTPLNDTSSVPISATMTTSTISSAPSATTNINPKESATTRVSAVGKSIQSAPVLFPATVPVSTPVSRPESTNSSGNISDYLSNNLFFGQHGGKEQGLPYPVDGQIKSEPQDDMIGSNDFAFQTKQHSNFNFLKHQQELVDPQEQPITNQDTEMSQDQSLLAGSSLSAHCQSQQQTNIFETKSESGSSDVMSRPPTPNSGAAGNLYGTMNDLINQQLENMGSNMGPPKKLQIVGKTFDKTSTPISSSISASTQFESNSSNSSSSSSSTSGGKRANRTRFTDYQIKVLQEFFENNSYPKDSDLEYLSKLLLLSPRVIVVWFQNARQKQRKIYENQPNNSLFENEETKKQNINYACKKCSLVFQRYYELIRHQKNHCFKEENNKKSAKAQIAAAQIAQNLSSEDSNSSMDIHHVGICPPGSTVVAQSLSTVGPAAPLAGQYAQQSFGALPSPQHLFAKSSSLTDFSPSTTPTPPQRERSNSLDHPQRPPKFDCDKCEMQFNQLEKLREHQLLHLMNPAKIFSDPGQNSNPDANFGPFGCILQSLQQAAAQQQQPQHQPPPTKKRKYSDSSSNADDMPTLSEPEAAHKKHEFLYNYFMQNETNTELKQQFLMRQQHKKALQLQSQEQGNESDFEMDFLTNFYQQSELKKVSNYDFLLQYYRTQEEASLKTKSKQQHLFSSSKKPTIEFLLQYYQLNESKKFFQLVASPQTMPDGPGYNPSSQMPKPTTDEVSDDIGERSLEQATEIQKDEQEEQFSIDRPCEENALSKSKSAVEKFNNNNININLVQADTTETNGVQSVEMTEELSMAPSLIAVNDDNKYLSSRSLQKDDKEKSQYLHNLEDFLDATMIENNSQTLTFNDDEKACQKDESVHKANEMEKRSSVSPVNVSSKQNKRLRTTILPEQLNFLYECYQSESNPSRKMLEEISKKVNLKKRVVQVWFQNSRAKDKKSRNQRHYAHISDDNSYDGSSGKEVVSDLKTNGGPVEQDHESNLQDCQLCQVTQVNIRKHAFSVEHICKMKKLLEQTTELYAQSNGSGSDDNDSDREKRFYNLSKAFLFQHVVSNATSKANLTTGSGQDLDALPEENCMLNYDTASGDSKSHIQHSLPAEIVSEDVRKIAGNQELMQQLFNRNHITVIGGK